MTYDLRSAMKTAVNIGTAGVGTAALGFGGLGAIILGGAGLGAGAAGLNGLIDRDRPYKVESYQRKQKVPLTDEEVSRYGATSEKIINWTENFFGGIKALGINGGKELGREAIYLGKKAGKYTTKKADEAKDYVKGEILKDSESQQRRLARKIDHSMRAYHEIQRVMGSEDPRLPEIKEDLYKWGVELRNLVEGREPSRTRIDERIVDYVQRTRERATERAQNTREMGDLAEEAYTEIIESQDLSNRDKARELRKIYNTVVEEDPSQSHPIFRKIVGSVRELENISRENSTPRLTERIKQYSLERARSIENGIFTRAEKIGEWVEPYLESLEKIPGKINAELTKTGRVVKECAIETIQDMDEGYNSKVKPKLKEWNARSIETLDKIAKKIKEKETTSNHTMDYDNATEFMKGQDRVRALKRLYNRIITEDPSQSHPVLRKIVKELRELER